ncbi:MAG TPA: hypothetical protein VF883_19305 [Thermoanaerobaculia bacterium]|jgi:uncharacterized membrane protein
MQATATCYRPRVEPEFQRALLVVLVAGTVVVGIGATVLFLAFRGAQKGRSMHMGLIGGLVAFVFLCCLALFALSYAAEH